MRKMQDPVRTNIAAKVDKGRQTGTQPLPSGQAAAESYNSQQSGQANVIKAK